MGIISFNQQKNKRFKYKPRFDENEVTSEPVSKSDDLAFKWKKTKSTLRGGKRSRLSIRILIIFLIGIIIVMYYLENNY